MRREDARVSVVLERLAVALGASDSRIVAFRNTTTDDGVSRLAEEVLADHSLGPDAVRWALWLLPLFPTRLLLEEAIDVMKRRPELALAAGQEIANLRDSSTLAEIETVLLDGSLSPQTRAAAASTLAKFRNPRSKQALLRAVREPSQDPRVLATTVGALGILQLVEKSGDLVSELRPLLQADSPDVRVSVLTVLGNLGAHEAIGEVEELIADVATTSSGECVGERAAEVSRLLHAHSRL